MRGPSLSLAVLAACSSLPAAELTGSIRQAFAEYAARVEPSVRTSVEAGRLWADEDPERLAAARRGEVPAQRRETPTVDGGRIEHWVGTVFLPGVTLAQVLRVDQAYDDHSRLYEGVDASRLLRRDGDTFDIYLRLRKKTVITAVIDTKHRVEYVRFDGGRVYSRSESTEVREVRDAGTPKETVLEPGAGYGFLWAMNSYWRLVERDGGVYAECESVTLSRQLPSALNALFAPVIKSLAAGAIRSTLEAKRKSITRGGLEGR